MKECYKPTENLLLKNFQFRSLVQDTDESFATFCNRVEKEAKHCSFKCTHNDCTAEQTATRDQILIGTSDKKIRKEALMKSWDLATLRRGGMRMESAAKSGAVMSGESVNKIGKYSHRNLKSAEPKSRHKSTPVNCCNCGHLVTGSIRKHVRSECAAIGKRCDDCQRTGDIYNIEIFRVEKETQNKQSEDIAQYDVNICRARTPQNKVLPTWQRNINCDFKATVVVNNNLSSPLADTGAKVSVCGTVQAKRWNLLSRMVPSAAKLKPYNSSPIPVLGVSRCAVTFGSTSIPVEWHIISGSCEPILDGNSALRLGIISFNSSAGIFHPVLMVDKDASDPHKEQLQSILKDYKHVFEGLGRMKNHHVKLHVKPNTKPIRDAPRTVPYHLADRSWSAVQTMLKQGVIEPHPINEPAPWVSNVVFREKEEGELRVTMDARNVNEAIQSSNLPIPKQEDIKVKLAHKKYFSKLDFKSAFWQLELAPESRYLTVFQIFDQLFRYVVLTMGLKPAQGELNAALTALFAHIQDVHVIHDDVVVVTDTVEEHLRAIRLLLEAISKAGLTLNPKKCTFLAKEINFWGMIFGEQGVRPNPEKVDDLQFLTPPQDKQQLISFLCMMQSNSDFIPQFAKKSAILRELTKARSRFVWGREHQKCFEYLVDEFKKDVTLRYFDLNKPTFVITDAHKSGLGVILAQGDDINSAKAVAVASRRTSPAEQHYPQIDLEATGVDYGLTRFRNYLIGSPHVTFVVTDHKPLVSIFNGRRKGSVRTERIKFRHQHIDFSVKYQKGSSNQADYLSRHAKPYENISANEKSNANEVNKLLYTLHTTPIMDHVGLSTIAEETSKDPILSKLRDILKRSQTWIPKEAPEGLRRFSKMMTELTVTGNGIILKSDRIVLPESLHQTVIELAHRGSHPAQSSMERRLRTHFFFPNMDSKVRTFLSTCLLCNSFTEKKTSEPLGHHPVPQRCWETVAVDLFGPMPSKNHIIVVQDLAS